VTNFMNGWLGRVGLPLGSLREKALAAENGAPDLSRRLVLTGAGAVACAAVFAALPSPAAAQIEFRFGDDDDHSRWRSENDHSRRRSEDDHSRRRSEDNHSRRRSFDNHGRRRSRDMHSRRRSSGHGRRRSRAQFRDWNEDCVLTPFGWICF